MSEKAQQVLKKYNIPSSLTDSGIGLQEVHYPAANLFK